MGHDFFDFLYHEFFFALCMK